MARYLEIAADLRSKITGKAPGDKLPSEPDLIEEYHASRTTVRQALSELRLAGLVEMRHGRGVYVAAPRVIRRLDSRERLSRARRQRNEAAFLAEASTRGFAADVDVKVWFEPASAEHAEALGVDEGAELCVRDRVMRADGAPVMLSTSRMPREITRETQLEESDTGSGGALARLEDLGYAITEHEEIVRARTPNADERHALALKTDPVLDIRRRTWSEDRIVESNDMVLRSDTYELRYAWQTD